jgi:hypothetical protein
VPAFERIAKVARLFFSRTDVSESDDHS